MTDEERTAFAAAVRIRRRLLGSSQAKLAVRLPTDYWERISRLARQIETANRKGWPSAAQSLRSDLAHAVDFCRDRLVELFTELDKEPKPVPSLSTLYREILALYQEFEEVKIDLKAGQIDVTTEPIMLEGFFLGPFQIQLTWEKLGHPSPYYVKALDPHPAAVNDAVTHPHVQDERLCEGDGRTAIQNALLEGRLTDFFLLVAQVLRTYGKGSAFIELDDWEGAFCSDCGESTGDYDRYSCNRCDATLCDTCSRTCSNCDCTYCSGCLEPCAICEDSFCASCLSLCKTCHESVCNHCLTNGFCEKCHAKFEHHDADESVGDESCDGDRSVASIAAA